MPKVKRLLGISFFELLHPSLEVVDVDGPGEVCVFGFPLSWKAALKRG